MEEDSIAKNNKREVTETETNTDDLYRDCIWRNGGSDSSNLLYDLSVWKR